MVNVIRYSLEQKQDHLRAVHCRPGPIGKFIHGILERGGSIIYVDFNANDTLRISVSLSEDLIEQFENETGFGLFNTIKEEID